MVDVAGVLQSAGDATVRAQERRAHFSHEFLVGIGVDTLTPAQNATQPAGVTCPVGQLMQCRGVVALGFREPCWWRQLDEVLVRRIEGTVATVTDHRTGLGQHRIGFGLWTPLRLLPKLEAFGQKLDLTAVEDDIALQHRYDALGLFALGVGEAVVSIFDLLHAEEDDGRAVLALADSATQFVGLLER